MATRKVKSTPTAEMAALHERIAELEALAKERTKGAEQALKASEERYRGLVENAIVCIHELSLKGRFTAVNRAGLRMMEANHESEICGLDYLDVVCAADRDRVANLLARARQGHAATFEFNGTVDGEERVFASSFVPIRDESGCVQRLMGVTEDITERRRAEQALREAHNLLEKRVEHRTHELQEANSRLRSEIVERTQAEQELVSSEQRLRAIFDHAFQFIGLLSPDGTLLQANHTSLNSAGIVESDVVGRPFWETVWWTHSPQLQGRLRQAIRRAAQGEVDRFETTHPTAEGSLITIDFSLTPVKDETGAVVLLIPEGHDVTARKRAEEALLDRDQQLERLLDAALRLNTQRELEKLLQEVADSARKVIGCRYAALGVLSPGGDQIDNFVVSGMSPAEVERLGDFPTGKGVLGLLTTHQDPLRLADLSKHPESYGFPAGHPAMRSFLGVPVIGRNGSIGNLYFTEKDGAAEFTSEDEAAAKMLAAEVAVAVENARLLTELRNLHVSRDRFYAMVNHELRNALTGVYGWAEMLVRKFRNDPPRAAIETMESAEYAIEMLNDLLDLSRLEADKIELLVAKVDARDIVNEAVKAVRPSADEAGVTFQVRGVDESVPCRTDWVRVRQILINLLRNAIRHSGTKDAILELAADDTQLRFDVVDHGEGISQEQQAIIFDAYERAGSTAGGGTGLGLTLCRNLSRLLGGGIEVESKLGEGARFTVRIDRHLEP